MKTTPTSEPKKISITQRNETAAFEVAVSRIQSNTGLSIMDSIIMYCQRANIEVELAAKLITPALKTKLKKEAVELHFIKTRKSRTPKV